MSKRDNLLLKLQNNPTNAKYETIQSLLLRFGFKERAPRGGSSHYTYTYKGTIITIPKHKPVKAIYRIKETMSRYELCSYLLRRESFLDIMIMFQNLYSKNVTLS